MKIAFREESSLARGEFKMFNRSRSCSLSASAMHVNIDIGSLIGAQQTMTHWVGSGFVALRGVINTVGSERAFCTLRQSIIDNIQLGWSGCYPTTTAVCNA